MIGVDYELFWKLNPRTIRPFFKAFDLRQEYDNSMAWRHGLYVQLAIKSSLSKDVKYPNRPLGVNKSDNTIENIKAKMFNTMKIVNSRFGKE